MKEIHKPGISELFGFIYQKRLASFRANLLKAVKTLHEQDIHKMRVDMKKLSALNDLIGSGRNYSLKQHKESVEFNRLFRISGKIREIQVCNQLIDRYNYPEPEIKPFRDFLRRKETNHQKQFRKHIKNFDLGSLKIRQKKLLKNFNKDKKSVIISGTMNFLLKKLAQIARLSTHIESSQDVHRIRKLLKVMATVASVRYALSTDEQLKMLLQKIHPVAALIGDWHDKTVLINYVGLFLRKEMSESVTTPSPIRHFYELLQEDCRSLYEQIIQDTRQLVSDAVIV